MILKRSALLLVCGVILFVLTGCGKLQEADVQNMALDITESSSPEEILNFSAGRTTIPEEYTIEDFPIIGQMPELPTGCEITALSMVLEYYGLDVDKVELAEIYLPTASLDLYEGEDGRLYGPDLNEAFIGDPASEWGIICGVPAILSAADGYLRDQGSTLRAENLTGSSPEELYSLVRGGTPVVVWVTIDMADRRETEGWYTGTGEYVDWSVNDHGAVLIGYGADTVTIADPISGLTEYSRQQFESVFHSRGRQCAALTEMEI